MASAGAGARNRGHQWERDVAALLTSHGRFGHVVTSRSVGAWGDDLVNQAHDGTWSRLPVSLELKAVGQGCWPGEAQLESWLDQAQRQAAGRPYRVVWKRHRQPTAAGLVIDRRRVAQPLGYWLEEQAADHAGRLLHTVAPPASGLELAPWAEVVELLDAAVAAAPWLEGWSA